MKNKLYISLFAAVALGFTSCESDIDNFMVDDTVGLLNSGLIETEVYSGVDDPFKLYAIKAGKGFNSATASITVDHVILQEYNDVNAEAQLAQLPADCYTISVSTITLTNEDYRVPFIIDWNQDKLEAALAENADLVIPVRMSVQTDGKIAENRLTALVKPTIVEPMIGFDTKNAGYMLGEMPTRKTSEELEIYFKVNANFIAQRDIDYTLELDPSLIEAYNESRGTDFVMLPEDAYDIDLNGGTIKQHLSSDMFKIDFHRNAIIPTDGPSKFGNYMLPIRIKSLSSSNIDPEKDYVLYAVQVIPVEISKSKWTVIECNNTLEDEPTATPEMISKFDPSMLIDGDKSTYWRTAFSDEQTLPYYVVIDLGQDRNLFKLEAAVPSTRADKSYANNKAGYVEVSMDNETWTKVGEWSTLSYTSTMSSTLEACTARYVKFVITDVHKAENTVGSGSSKVNCHNGTAVAEITLWGE